MGEDAALPGVLREVAALAGLGAALQLARAKGGIRVYVAKQPSPRLSAEIGDAAAAALSRLYGGEHVDIPLGPEGGRARAYRAAGQALAQGLSAGAAARRSGLTERAVYRIKAKRRQGRSSAQGRLFEDEAP